MYVCTMHIFLILIHVAMMHIPIMHLYMILDPDTCMYDAYIYVPWLWCMWVWCTYLWSWTLILKHACMYGACIYDAIFFGNQRTNKQGDSRSWMHISIMNVIDILYLDAWCNDAYIHTHIHDPWSWYKHVWCIYVPRSLTLIHVCMMHISMILDLDPETCMHAYILDPDTCGYDAHSYYAFIYDPWSWYCLLYTSDAADE